MKLASTSSPIASKGMHQKTLYPILFLICFSHLMNDLMQAIIPSVYPIIKDKYDFSFTQIGMITCTYQITASILQPAIGYYTDRKPQPTSLPFAMIFTMGGIIILAFAHTFYLFLVAVALVGLGSSIFHPESSRIAYLSSGGRKGLAQSIFQLGGHIGTSIGPLLTALIIIPLGQLSLLYFCIAALLGIFLLRFISKWYRNYLQHTTIIPKSTAILATPTRTKKQIQIALTILLILLFSKYIYLASMTNYFTFYLIDKFKVSLPYAQYALFAFLAAIALGTMIGGPIGDRVGRKYVIWFSILGVAPFTLLLPHLNLIGTISMAIIIGLILSSAFSAIMLYAIDLMPGKVGTIAGLFYGFMFGIAGIGSAALGWLADQYSINDVFYLCSFLPLLGIITVFLPNIKNPIIKPENV